MKTSSAQKNKELGVLMLLLAADTVADVCTTLSNNGSPLPVDLSNPHSTELAHAASRSDMKLLHNKVSPSSYSASTDDSDGDTDSNGTPLPEGSDDVGVVVELSSLRWGSRLDDRQVVDRIMSFVDWRTAVKARQVNRAWMSASLSAAVVCRLPHAKAPAVFVPCRLSPAAMMRKRDEVRLCLTPTPTTTTTTTHFTSDAASTATSPLPSHWVDWRCTHCDAQNLSTRRTCAGCGNQQRGTTTTRIFLGQLRRDATVTMVRWFVEDVCGVPKGSLQSIENHCNKLTGRGKGCAWAYVEDDGVAAERVLSFHHRAYYDVMNGVEGVWIVHPAHSEALTDDAAIRGAASDRPRFMPRTAMVVELPARAATSALRVPSYAHTAPWSTPYSSNGTMGAPAMVSSLPAASDIAPPPPPSYTEFATADDNATWMTEVPCWDMYGRPARRYNPYATM